MRTAIISDLHLGVASDEDVLRDPEVRRLLLEEIAGEPLGLEHHHAPFPGPAALLDEWLGSARLKIAYPGIWLRGDVYATHGHYMDAHLALPRAECIAAATMIRLAGSLPDRAVPADYERVLRPIYGFAFGLAQMMQVKRRSDERAWKVLAGEATDLRARAARAGFPVAIRGLNALLRSDFKPDVTTPAIFRSGLAAAVETAVRLGVDDVHVITGHTHRTGPMPDEAEWPLPRDGRLHNTGSWVFGSAFHKPGAPPNSYWPGTVTWLEDDEPPRRVRLLQDRSHTQMTELIERKR